MTDFLEAERAALIAGVAAISDPVERYRKIGELEKLVDRDLKTAKAAVANELHEGRTWEQVGELLGGVTASRAQQIGRGRR